MPFSTDATHSEVSKNSSRNSWDFLADFLEKNDAQVLHGSSTVYRSLAGDYAFRIRICVNSEMSLNLDFL